MIVRYGELADLGVVPVKFGGPMPLRRATQRAVPVSRQPLPLAQPRAVPVSTAQLPVTSSGQTAPAPAGPSGQPGMPGRAGRGGGGGPPSSAPPSDVGAPSPDAGGAPQDPGANADAGAPPADAGGPPADAGGAPQDAGPQDQGQPQDAGGAPDDAQPSDTQPSEQAIPDGGLGDLPWMPSPAWGLLGALALGAGIWAYASWRRLCLKTPILP